MIGASLSAVDPADIASIDVLKFDQMSDFQAKNINTNRSIKEYINKDPDLAANMRRLVDNILLNNPVLTYKDNTTAGSKKKLKDRNDSLTENRFFKKLRSAVYSLIWAGNAFLEVQYKTDGSLKEIYFIDPEYMYFVKNKAGEVTGYKQEVPSHKPVHFNKDNIIHITIDHLDSGASGESFIGALKDVLSRKDIAESYLNWIIANNKLNRFWQVTGDMEEDSWRSTVQMLRYSSQNPNQTTVVNVEEGVTIDFKRYFDTEDFDAIMKYIEVQNKAILAILQVPPIISGSVDGSNRSNSEIQARFVFYNTIKNFQKLLVDELNEEFLRKMQWKDMQFQFPVADKQLTAEVFKIASAMQGLGFTQEAILEYLKSEGFKIPAIDNLFEPKVEEGAGNNFGGRNPLSPTASREARPKTGIPENEKKRASDKKAGVGNDNN